MKSEFYLTSYCISGNIDGFKQYFQNNINKININKDLNEGFNWGCINGHLPIIQHIKQINPNINVGMHNENCFRWACFKGHIDIIKQLYEWKTDWDINFINGYYYLIKPQIIDLIHSSKNYDWLNKIETSDIFECEVCFQNREYVNLPCGHQFCVICIKDWMKHKNNCPKCRENLNFKY